MQTLDIVVNTCHNRFINLTRIKMNKIISELQNDGFDLAQIKECLCDGELIGNKSWSESDVEEAYVQIIAMIKETK